jgi:hypothetical protein
LSAVFLFYIESQAEKYFSWFTCVITFEEKKIKISHHGKIFNACADTLG